MQAKKHASEGSTLFLKPKTDVIRSLKQGYQWPHKQKWCPSKICELTAGKIIAYIFSKKQNRFLNFLNTKIFRLIFYNG